MTPEMTAMGSCHQASALLVCETECYADYGLLGRDSRPRDTGRRPGTGGGWGGANDGIIATVQFPIVAGVMGTAQRWTTQTNIHPRGGTTLGLESDCPTRGVDAKPGPTAAEGTIHAPLDQGPSS